MTADSPDRRLAYLAWIAVCVIWGTTYLGIRICLETMPPFLMAGLRWTIAGGLVLLALRLRGEPLPRRSHWGGLFLLSLLFIVLGNGGVVWAEQWVPSGLTAVIIATSPFWMVGLDSILPDGERLRTKRVLGLLAGFAGILILVWPELAVPGGAGRQFAVGVVSLQIACAGWALGSLYSRRHARDENAITTAGCEMLFGGIVMLTLATIRMEWPSLYFTTRTTAAFVYLTSIGAIGGFVAYLYALKHLPVSTVSLYAYVNPIIAVLLGALVLGEPFNARIVLAAGLVLGGVAVVRS